jgi:hypothetical protein
VAPLDSGQNKARKNIKRAHYLPARNINSHHIDSHNQLPQTIITLLYRQWPPRLHCVSHDFDYDLFYDTASLVKYSNYDYSASDDPYRTIWVILSTTVILYPSNRHSLVFPIRSDHHSLSHCFSSTIGNLASTLCPPKKEHPYNAKHGTAERFHTQHQ